MRTRLAITVGTGMLWALLFALAISNPIGWILFAIPSYAIVRGLYRHVRRGRAATRQEAIDAEQFRAQWLLLHGSEFGDRP